KLIYFTLSVKKREKIGFCYFSVSRVLLRCWCKLSPGLIEKSEVPSTRWPMHIRSNTYWISFCENLPLTTHCVTTHFTTKESIGSQVAPYFSCASFRVGYCMGTKVRSTTELE